MRKTSIQSLLAILFTVCTLSTACNDHNDENWNEALNTTYVKYALSLNYDTQEEIGSDLHTFYNIEATYIDFDNISHTEQINADTWQHKEETKGSNRSMFCKITATLKPDYQIGQTKALYDLRYNCSVHWYSPESTAKSYNPTQWDGQVVKYQDLAKYLEDHPVITLLNFSREM